MVTFNELRICEDGSYLIVDCEIENVDVYKNMYIKKISLEYYKNASAAGMPSSKAYTLYENDSDNRTVRAKRITFKEVELGLTSFGISTFAGGLFYVIVESDGVLPSDIAQYPCGYDNTTDIGAVIDWSAFYNKGMGYITSLFDTCGNPCEPTDAFEHFILLWNALKLAIETCEWDTVKDLWEKFLLSPRSNGVSSSVAAITGGGCGCRG